MAEGAVLLRGFARAFEAELLPALRAIVRQAPFRHLITPGGHPDAAGVFVPDTTGSKLVLVNMPLKGYSQMAVTTEDAPDGSTAPSQQPQLYGSLR